MSDNFRVAFLLVYGVMCNDRNDILGIFTFCVHGIGVLACDHGRRAPLTGRASTEDGGAGSQTLKQLSSEKRVTKQKWCFVSLVYFKTSTTVLDLVFHTSKYVLAVSRLHVAARNPEVSHFKLQIPNIKTCICMFPHDVLAVSLLHAAARNPQLAAPSEAHGFRFQPCKETVLAKTVRGAAPKQEGGNKNNRVEKGGAVFDQNFVHTSHIGQGGGSQIKMTPAQESGELSVSILGSAFWTCGA